MSRKPIIIFRIFLALFLVFSSLFSFGQNLDSLLNKMTLREKIAQLITIRSFGDKDDAYYRNIENQIKKYGFGGICFFKSESTGLATAHNLYDKTAKIPVLYSIDGEWGVAMRVTDALAFPFNQTLGALQDDSLVFKLGEYVGEQCNRLGIQWNYAPCVDVNFNPQNPVINNRSFGEDAENVAHKSLAYMLGMHSKGVMSSAKHFPGHGDTDVDSHFDLPSINKTVEEINNVDLAPYKLLIDNGLSSVMVAHLFVPAYDTAKFSSTVSKMIVDTLLKQQLGHKGIIVSDGMEMKGFYKNASLADLEVRVLQAGIDVILVPENPIKTIDYIENGVKDGRISEELINEKCLKILNIKKNLGLFNAKNKVIEIKNLKKDLNQEKYKRLNQEIYNSVITLLKNDNNIIPIKNKYSDKDIAIINISTAKNDAFVEKFLENKQADVFLVGDEQMKDNAFSNRFSSYKIVIISFSNSNTSANKNYGLTKDIINFIEKIAKQESKVILNIFANPYSISKFNKLDNIDCLIAAYQNNIYAKNAVIDAIFGKIDFKGKLPVSISDKFPVNFGLAHTYSELLPSETGILNKKFEKKIDSLINLYIADTVFPGCQILYAKDAKILYNKAFGNYLYDETLPVSTESIYDVASITKVAATTLAMMKLFDEKRYKLDDTLSQYLDFLRESDKSQITFRQILGHQAGLIPSSSISKDFFYYNDTVTQQQKNDSLIAYILCGKMQKKPYKYKYSDVGFILLAMFVEKTTGIPLNDYVFQEFYEPLGLTHTSFLPKDKFHINQIVPTMIDTVYRQKLIWAEVHDPTVALMGGVGGSAGLFSNAQDIAVIFQMLLNDGVYRDKRYFTPQTVETFTRRILPNNRRGAGFDKPLEKYDEKGNPCAKSASYLSFGHSGFTGCFVWADPANDMIFILLSNRVYPYQDNNKITKQNIRPLLQELGYQYLP